MSKNHSKTFVCPVCKKQKPNMDRMHGELIRPHMIELIRKNNPEWKSDDCVCIECLQHFRGDYIQGVLETEKGELSRLDQEVVDSLREQDLISQDLNVQFDKQLTFGERVADKVAEFGGSWNFIIIFGVIIVAWIVLNSIALLHKPFDPYPYILLNLVLSCVAAMQAPVIMMSQNRQEDKDRMRAEHDYRINLKAELEIRHLNAKVDQLLTHQWQRLLEIQQIQMESMEELIRKQGTKG